ncbi:rna polymerase ii accessory factor cdc73, partial [Cystoisospora suis]
MMDLAPSQFSSLAHEHGSADDSSIPSLVSSVELNGSQKPQSEGGSSFSAGDGYSGYSPSSGGGGKQESSGLAVNPLSLIYLNVFRKGPSDSMVCRLDTVRGEEALVFPEFNCYSPARLPSGLESRRKELFTLADIFLLLSTPKELYTYTHIAQQGHKYINVLERAKITAFFEALGSNKASLPPVGPPSVTGSSSTGSSASGSSTAAGGGGLGEEILGPEKQFLFSSLSTPTASQGSVFPLDPAQPVKLPGFVLPGEIDGDRVQGIPDGQGRDLSKLGVQTLNAELDGVMPQAWSEVDVKCLVDAVNTGLRELKSFHEEKEKTNGTSVSGADDDYHEEQGTQRRRAHAVAEALSALAFYRMERPVVLRSSTIKLEDSPFERIIQTFSDVEKERWAGRPLAQFSHQPRPDQRLPASGGSFSKGGSSGGGRAGSSASAGRLGGVGGRTGTASGGLYGGNGRRGDESDTKISRMPCVLDEVCVHRKRKPIILIPPVTSMGGTGFLAALLTRFNVIDLLENGNFISPQAAKERAAR